MKILKYTLGFILLTIVIIGVYVVLTLWASDLKLYSKDELSEVTITKVDKSFFIHFKTSTKSFYYPALISIDQKENKVEIGVYKSFAWGPIHGGIMFTPRAYDVILNPTLGKQPRVKVDYNVVDEQISVFNSTSTPVFLLKTSDGETPIVVENATSSTSTPTVVEVKKTTVVPVAKEISQKNATTTPTSTIVKKVPVASVSSLKDKIIFDTPSVFRRYGCGYGDLTGSMAFEFKSRDLKELNVVLYKLGSTTPIQLVEGTSVVYKVDSNGFELRRTGVLTPETLSPTIRGDFIGFAEIQDVATGDFVRSPNFQFRVLPSTCEI